MTNYGYSTIRATTTYTYLKQTLSDLDTTKAYDLSVDYRITGGSSSQWCYLTWSKDGWSGFLSRIMVYPSTSEAWTKYSEAWQPTASSHDIYFVFACIGGSTTLDFDNFQMPIATTSVCSTSAPSPTAIISSSVLVSSIVSSAAVTSTTAASSSIVIETAHSSALSRTSRVSSVALPTPTPSSAPSSASSSRVSSTSLSVQSSLATLINLSPSGHLPSLTSARPAKSTEAAGLSQTASSTPSSIPIAPASSTTLSHILSTPLSSAHASSVAIPVFSSTGILLSTPSFAPTHGHGSVAPSIGSSKPTSLSPMAPSQPDGGSHRVTGIPPAITNRPGIPKASEAPPSMTTSTVLTTRVSTITACPSTVAHCPAASRTTFVSTETVVAYTTVCPATGTVVAVQATETTSSIFSTRTSTVTSCPDRQQYCALPNRKTETFKETILVSTTAYLAAVPTSDRRPIFIGDFAISGVFPEPTQNAQSSGSKGLVSESQFGSGSELGSESVSGSGSGSVNIIDGQAEYQAEVTKTQFVFSTIYVTQTAPAIACPSVQGPPAQSQAPQSSVRPVYF